VNDLEDFFEQIEDEPIRGGCSQCDAFQVLTEASAGVWHLVVHHDDGCSVLRATRAEAN
jgi:hypothetical protein